MANDTTLSTKDWKERVSALKMRQFSLEAVNNFG
jgi:hypothetical protein